MPGNTDSLYSPCRKEGKGDNFKSVYGYNNSANLRFHINRKNENKTVLHIQHDDCIHADLLPAFCTG